MVTQQWPDPSEESSHATRKQITLTLDIDKVVRVTKDRGGYKEGECVACGAHGWMHTRYGYPHGSRAGKEKGNGINHKKDCPMNAYLNNDGSLKD
jgi:hypothetical protein